MKKNTLPNAVAVVIPARNEPNGLQAIQSLVDLSFTEIHIEIMVVINASSLDETQIIQNNLHLKNEIEAWKDQLPQNYRVECIIEHDLPIKEAGVGLARKIGMDKVALKHKENKMEAVLICFDADCIAPPGYLKCIYHEFVHQQLELASIHYQHTVVNPLDPIVDYELFLRYYAYNLKKSGYPHWHQTIGSCMAVLSSKYLKHGGMNKKKAGEDFYFMHKMMPVCKTATIRTTCNLLSPRESDRVPFGTGRAMIEANTTRIATYYTYAPQIFDEIGKFLKAFENVETDEDIQKFMAARHSKVHAFFILNNWWSEVASLRQNVKTVAQFKTRFYQYFTGFKLLKFIHWARDTYYTNIPLNQAVNNCLQTGSKPLSNFQLLQKLRIM